MKSAESLKSLALSLEAEVFENEPMSRHTTFKIGGPADVFVIPRDEKVFFALCTFCNNSGIPLFIVGNGSNLLVSDKGIRGVVIKSPSSQGIFCEGEFLSCGAGEQLSKVCEFALNCELSGLEFAYGIPGTVGGAVYMNAGAYGGEMKDVVVKVCHIDGVETGSYDKDGLCFGYRHSAYSGTHKIITRVKFALHHGDKSQIKEKMSDFMERRRLKQPLEWPSAGSIFKRPAGNFAGTLIEKCRLKGIFVGGAAVSEKHAGFIINKGGATCCDVLELVSKIQEEVLRQTGFSLECEIREAGEI